MDTANTDTLPATAAASETSAQALLLPPAYTLLPAAGTGALTPSQQQLHSAIAANITATHLPAYDDPEHGDSSRSMTPSDEKTKDSASAAAPPDSTMITHYVLDTDTLFGLSLKYNVPVSRTAIQTANPFFTQPLTDFLPFLPSTSYTQISAIRRANSLFSDTTLPARSKLFIPLSTTAAQSLSPHPSAQDEHKRLVKRFQLVAKCVDADEAWSYMRQNEFVLEAALEQWWGDVKWEKENAGRKAGKANSSSIGSGGSGGNGNGGKWKKGKGL
ncbi:hypothetical protein HDU86_005638 [Geranomyces michiganensis]|nr:hypothetical protein HDU86_005638 [Geranomyces michiganensis]